jgi:hypothetical protein
MKLAASCLLLALGACAAAPRTAEELNELARIRAEIDAARDELGNQLRKLRELTPPPPPVQLSGAPTSHVANDLHWVLAPLTIRGDPRTALVLYRVTSRGFQLEGVRILEDDLAKALK